MASFIFPDENSAIEGNSSGIELSSADDNTFSLKNGLSPLAAAAESATQEKTEEELLAESERLAWELMQQESLDVYNMQVEFMRQNAESLDAVDLAALEMAMAEERMHVTSTGIAQNNEEEEQDEENADGDNSEPWTYDQLLALGEAVGGGNALSFSKATVFLNIFVLDVKTERWRIRAPTLIQCLPILKYGTIVVRTHFFLPGAF
jgi:hypothetical protein